MNFSVVVCAVAAVCLAGCSQDDRDEISSRVSAAGQALAGDSSTPKVVRDQQRKERIRQDTKWTAENQALHPIEYCQSQLEELDRYSTRLTVIVHDLNVNKSAVLRDVAENEAKRNYINAFLKEAKEKYRESQSRGRQEAVVGNYTFSLQKLKERMVEENSRLPYLSERIQSRKSVVERLERSLDLVSAEQRKLSDMRQRIRHTIEDLQLKRVVDGEKSMKAALDAISDSMSSLGVDYDEPTIEDIMQPGKIQKIDSEFEKLMAE